MDLISFKEEAEKLARSGSRYQESGEGEPSAYWHGVLEAIDSTGLFAAYKHAWNDKWRSSLIYSRIDIDNDTALAGTGVSKESERAAVNLIYQAAPKLKLGGEISRANREVESGADGSMTRLQFTAVLSF